MSTILTRLNGVQSRGQMVNAAEVKSYGGLRKLVSKTLDDGRKQAQDAVEKVKARTYWDIGRLIDAHVLQSQKRGDYGKQVIQRLAGDLKTNQTLLYYALQFARSYKELPEADSMTWSHYRALLPVKDEKKRQSLESRVEEWGWSSRQLELAISKEKKKKTAGAGSAAEAVSDFTAGVSGFYRVVKRPGKSGLCELSLGFDLFYRPENFPAKFNAGDIACLDPNGKTGRWIKGAVSQAADLNCYDAVVVECNNDSSLTLRLNLGFGIARLQKVTLRGVQPGTDTAKMKRLLREMGKAATVQWIARIYHDRDRVPGADLFCGAESFNKRLLTSSK